MRQRLVEQGGGPAVVAEAGVQVGQHGWQQVIPGQPRVGGEPFGFGQGGIGAQHLGERDDAVEGCHRRRPAGHQRVVERQDVRPVGGGPVGRGGVRRGDRRLEMEAALDLAAGGPVERVHALGEQH